MYILLTCIVITCPSIKNNEYHMYEIRKCGESSILKMWINLRAGKVDTCVYTMYEPVLIISTCGKCLLAIRVVQLF